MTKIFKDQRPIIGQDPFVYKIDGITYLIQSVNEKQIVCYKFQSYTGKDGRLLWERQEEQQVWAPEMHQIGNKWCIFYCYSNGMNHSHRTHVLISDNPFGPFNRKRIGPDFWGIDMTVFEKDGKWYGVWSGWENYSDEFPQHLYIGELDPENIEIHERVKLSSPEYSWELSHRPILEGPQAYQADGNTVLFFSANASWTTDYCTGIMKLVGEDPLNPADWWKCPEPMGYNIGHGHALDGYFIYHRKMSPFPGWTDREIKVAPLERMM